MLKEEDVKLILALANQKSRLGQELVDHRLSHIIRYQGLETVHPSNVANHQQMVHMIASCVATSWAEEMHIYCDIEPAIVNEMARLHDDHEADPTIGDITSNIKDGMTEADMADLKAREDQAHRRFAVEFYGLRPGSPEFERFLQTKRELEELATPEAECVKIADTLHAIWETLHECLAGNISFYPVLERYQRVASELAVRSPIWEKLRYHPKIQLDPDRFPTPAKVQTMPIITEAQISGVNAEDWSTLLAFEEAMHNPLYPAWYGTGVDLALLTFGIGKSAGVLFPKWRTSFFIDE